MGESAHLLLEQLRFTQSVLEAMTLFAAIWWTSATAICVVLCGGVLSLIDQIARLQRLSRLILFYAGLTFIFSIVLFGFFLVIFARSQRQQFFDLCEMLGVPAMATQFDFYSFGVLVGASTFVLFIAAWLSIWQGVHSRAKRIS